MMLKRAFKSAFTRLLIGLLLLGQGAPFEANARGARGGVEALPAAVVAAGYTKQTFGPTVTLGTNIFNFNFAGITPIGGQTVQNGDGSISFPITDGSGYGAGAGTATKVGGSWTGIMFAGGWYAEAVIKFTATNTGGGFPFPSWWMQSEDWLLGHTNTWPGQTPPYAHRIEFDLMQWPHNSALFWLGPEINDWFGPASANSVQSVGGVVAGTGGSFTCTSTGTTLTMLVGAYVTITGSPPVYPAAGGIQGYTNPSYYKIGSTTDGKTQFTLTTLAGAAITTAAGAFPGGCCFVQINSLIQPDPHLNAEIKISQNASIQALLLSDYNRYGALYIPATAVSAGSVTTFLNGVPVPYAAGAPQITWPQYNAGLGPPPQYGINASSLLDNSLMMFIFGTDVTSPMTLKSLSVWQSPDNSNVVHP